MLPSDYRIRFDEISVHLSSQTRHATEDSIEFGLPAEFLASSHFAEERRVDGEGRGSLPEAPFAS